MPLSVGIAICLSELAPAWLREPLSFVVELLAAVPSVIYGLWAMYALRPILAQHVEPFSQLVLGWTPLFEGTAFGIDKFTAGVILAVMIIPTVASVSKETMMAVPDSQREAALSLGATRYETTRMAVLSYARSGIFGAAHPGARQGHGRDDGGHDDHREREQDLVVPPRPRTDDVQPDSEQLGRGRGLFSSLR